jgi:hypothetical protein
MPITLFELLRLHHPDLTPESSKVHLAVFNGTEHPIDVFRDGNFESWQAWQGKANFSRPYVVSLIRMMGSGDRWLYAGLHRPISVAPHPVAAKGVLYEMEALDDPAELSGRLVVRYKNTNRQMVPYGETIADELVVAEIRAKALSNRRFTGFSDIRLSKAELDAIMKHADPEWVSALASVQGVYLITDLETGRVYVGSATATTRGGEGGIWARWKQYSQDGHGGNVKLRALLDERGPDFARHFQFTILEVLPPHADEEAVKVREGHWKRALASVRHGYNDNLEKGVHQEW